MPCSPKSALAQFVSAPCRCRPDRSCNYRRPHEFWWRARRPEAGCSNQACPFQIFREIACATGWASAPNIFTTRTRLRSFRWAFAIPAAQEPAAMRHRAPNVRRCGESDCLRKCQRCVSPCWWDHMRKPTPWGLAGWATACAISRNICHNFCRCRIPRGDRESGRKTIHGSRQGFSQPCAPQFKRRWHDHGPQAGRLMHQEQKCSARATISSI